VEPVFETKLEMAEGGGFLSLNSFDSEFFPYFADASLFLEF
jgi:hypothetical protein